MSCSFIIDPEYDMKFLISKINQKCRDSNLVKVKKEHFPAKSSPPEVFQDMDDNQVINFY